MNENDSMMRYIMTEASKTVLVGTKRVVTTTDEGELVSVKDEWIDESAKKYFDRLMEIGRELQIADLKEHFKIQNPERFMSGDCEAGNECGWHPVYGFVPEAGCPIHGVDVSLRGWCV